jgi:hypothetical protein
MKKRTNERDSDLVSHRDRLSSKKLMGVVTSAVMRLMDRGMRIMCFHTVKVVNTKRKIISLRIAPVTTTDGITTLMNFRR